MAHNKKNKDKGAPKPVQDLAHLDHKIVHTFIAPKTEYRPRPQTYTLREAIEKLQSMAASHPEILDRELLMEDDGETFPVDFICMQNGQALVQTVTYTEPMDYSYKDKN